MEHLWNRTAGGERWLIAKTFIETYNFQAGFAGHLLQKAQKDSLLRGSILEFEARIKSLCRLLEIHDTQRIFYNMVEYGALGKVYGIISPIASQLAPNTNSSQIEKDTPQDKTSQQPIRRERHSFTSDELSLSPRQEENFPSFLSRPEETPLHFSLSEPTPENLKKHLHVPKSVHRRLTKKIKHRCRIESYPQRNSLNGTLCGRSYSSDTDRQYKRITGNKIVCTHSNSIAQSEKEPVFSENNANTQANTPGKSGTEPLAPSFSPRREISAKQPKPAVSPTTQTTRREKNKKLFRLMNLKKRLMRHRITITTNTHTHSEPGWMIKT